MTETEKLAKAAEIIGAHMDARESEDGDKWVADPNLAIEALEELIKFGRDDQAVRDGFLTRS